VQKWKLQNLIDLLPTFAGPFSTATSESIMSLNEVKKHEDKVFTNLGSSDLDIKDPLDEYAPRFGGTLPSDYNYMKAQQEISQTLQAMKKSAEDNEVQNFRMNSMRPAGRTGVTLVANKEKTQRVEAPQLKLSVKKRKSDETSEPKPAKEEKVIKTVTNETKGGSPDHADKKAKSTSAAAAVPAPAQKSAASILASYESSDEES
jgi:hypothetical protein